MTRSLGSIVFGFVLGLLVALATVAYAKAWPSAGGTTAQGSVIENGVDGSRITACGS